MGQLKNEPPGRLTRTEERVARLVAEGRTNDEIADEGTLQPTTVEARLTRVFSKLGVPSRTELAVLLTSGQPHGREAEAPSPRPAAVS